METVYFGQGHNNQWAFNTFPSSSSLSIRNRSNGEEFHFQPNGYLLSNGFVNVSPKNKEDIKIDYLHIDAGHSYESVKQDFELYSSILSPNGIISIHDTDLSFQKELIVTNDVKSENNFDDFSHGPSKLIREIKESGEWEVFNFFNNGILRTKPASTGLTFIQKCKK